MAAAFVCCVVETGETSASMDTIFTVLSEASTALYETTGPLTDLYRLKTELGCGSFSRVYRAVRISDGKEVAIKRIHKINCYILISGCSRPLYKEESSLMMEYLQPCVVRQKYICSNGLISEEITRGLMRQLVLALQNSLDCGTVHIQVNTRTLELKLIDFGCAYQSDIEKTETNIDSIFWDLGPLLCFMVTRIPPEFCTDKESVCCILSPELWDLIKKCVKPISEWKTLEQILQHQWFRQKPILEPLTVLDPESDAEPEPDAEQEPVIKLKPVPEPDPEHILDSEPVPDLEPVPELVTVPEAEPVPRPSGLQKTSDTEPSSVPEAFYCEPNNRCFTNLYRLENLLGCGSFSRVFKAVHKSDGKEVAIKMISKRIDDYYISIPGCSRPLLNEVAIMLLLKRPPVSTYVIEMYEWFDEPDSMSLIMEYPKPCVVLLDFVISKGHLSEEVTRCLIRQLILALQNCLDHGIVHNDLHDDNVLVNTRTLELKLIDFSFAYQFKRKECEHVDRDIAETIGYMSYLMMKGWPLMFSNARDLHQKLNSIPGLSSECCELIKRCLRRKPEWENLEEMLQHQWFKHQ